MRLILRVAVFLCVTGVVLYFFFNSPKPAPRTIAPPAAAVSPTPAAAPAVSANPSSAAAAPQSGTASSPGTSAASVAVPAAPLASASEAPDYTNLPPETVLENARAAVQLYGHMFGGNPVGTNPEITRALDGGNPKQVKFLQPDAGMRINDNGELIDPWGTPFFFHQLSGSVTEIRSAGPDRKMWTSDDLVTR